MQPSLTFHDGDMHCSPSCPWHTGQSWAMRDGGAASAWNQTSSEQREVKQYMVDHGSPRGEREKEGGEGTIIKTRG